MNPQSQSLETHGKQLLVCFEKEAASCHREIRLDKHQALPGTASSLYHSESLSCSQETSLQVMSDSRSLPGGDPGLCGHRLFRVRKRVC